MKTPDTNPTYSLTKLGNLLRTKRQLKGDKLKNISSDMGVSHAVISRIENGRYNLSVMMLLKLCDYYDISAEELTRTLSNML